MYELIPTEKYSVEKISKVLKFSTMLERGIRENFGDPISIDELKQISQSDFLSCRNFGRKRLREFQTAIRELSKNNERAVTVLNEPNINTIVVEIDLSISFKEVIKDLHEIIENIV
jgi:hypothetical protein